MDRKAYVVTTIFFLALFGFSMAITKAAPAVDLTPTSGEPDDLVGVEGADFSASSSVGIGFGNEVAVDDGSPTVIDNGEGSNPRVITGYAANIPIKPGSFYWVIDFGGTIVVYSDNGDGTLDSVNGANFTGTINYTTGYFTQTSTSLTSSSDDDHDIDYTTYEFDVTPAGIATNSSGGLLGEFNVPDIWNGTHTVTFIDEKGNVATADFTVEGSDVPEIPEALTIGVIVVLSSAALVASLYGLRKQSYCNRRV